MTRMGETLRSLLQIVQQYLACLETFFESIGRALSVWLEDEI
jgi:hypothetical protein